MHAGTIIGLPLALASTVLVNFSYVREQGAAAGLPPLSLRRPVRSAKLLLRSRAWLSAFAMESGGFGLYVVALALAPLALVQSVGAGGLGVLAIATARITRRRLTNREVAGASAAVLGLLLLAVSLTGGNAKGTNGKLGPILLWLGVTAGAGVLVFTSSRTFLQRGGVGDGIAGGLFFSIGDISTKIATQGGGRFLFAIPLIGGYLLGTSLIQIGYQSGSALTVAGLANLTTNALPIAAGTVVLHEQVPSGALGVLRILAFGAVTAGAILLARPEKRPESAPQSVVTPAETQRIADRKPAAPREH